MSLYRDPTRVPFVILVVVVTIIALGFTWKALQYV